MKKFLLKHKNIILLGLALISIASLVTWNKIKSNHTQIDLISGNGRIEASEIDMATKLGGRLIKIMVEEGELVESNQILAQMQTDILEAQFEESKAQYEQAIKMVDTALARVAVAENNLLASRSIASQRRAEYEARQKRLSRSQTLAKSGAVSLQILDDDRANCNSAKAALEAAQAQINANEALVIAAQTEVNGARATVAAFKANLKRIAVEISDSQLRAPCRARVQYKIAQPGEVLAAGGKVLSLVDLHDIHMIFFIPEHVVGRIALGTEVRIKLDAAPDYIIPARISFISSIAQFTPKTVETASERQKLMFRVKAKIAEEFVKSHLDQVKTGVPGEAFIKLTSQTSWPKDLMLRAEK